MLSNGLVALSGALLAQYQGSATIDMGRVIQPRGPDMPGGYQQGVIVHPDGQGGLGAGGGAPVPGDYEAIG